MKLRAALVASAVTMTSLVALAPPATAQSVALDRACADVEVIVARGSGQEVGTSDEMNAFLDDLEGFVGDGLTVNFYELGSEAQGGEQYPAVNVSNFLNGNAIGGFFSGGEAFDYGESVSEGVREMINYAIPRGFDCEDSRFVMAGYSQGAQVIGSSLEHMATVEQQTDFVALFGDPKLYLPEGEGIRPAACRGENFSAWRRVVPDCRTDSGSLRARKPYLPVEFMTKTGLWCNNDDFVCGSSKWGKTSGHMQYMEPGNGAELGAREAAQRIDASLGGGVVDHSVWNIGQGSGANLDVVFLLDTTGSMGSQISASEKFATEMADAVRAANGRVALVTYKDEGDDYTARIDSPLTDDLEAFEAALGRQYADGGGDTPEAMLHGLMTAFNGLEWKYGATKAAIVLTDAGFHDPDLVDGSTLETMAARSLEIDPVNVYPVVPSYLAPEYEAVASATSGKVIVDGGDTVASLMDALGQITTRPVAILPNSSYEAATGESIKFDASASYGVSADITGYEWDFDGDNAFDAHTTTPVVEYTYPGAFAGSMQVRITDEIGGIGSASVPVRVGQPVPAGPQAPIVSVAATAEPGQVTLSWTGTGAARWIISVDDVALGATVDHPVTITDIERDEDVTFSVTPVAEDGTVGETGFVVLSGEEQDATTPTLYSAHDLTLTNATSVAGDGADVVTGGSFSCNSSVAVDGDVVVAGDAYLTNDCTIGGDLHVGGDVRMDSSASVGGSVLAAGNIALHASNRVSGDVRARGTVTAPDGRSDAALHSLGTVSGDIKRGASVSAPDIAAASGSAPVDPFIAGQPGTPWASWVNGIAASHDAPSWAQGRSANPGCTMAAGAYSVNGTDVPVSAGTVVDARSATTGCGTISLQDMTLRLSADLTIVADSFATVGKFAVVSADGAPHRLRVVTQGATSRIDIAANAAVDQAVAVSLEAAGTVSVRTGADLRATVRTGSFRSDGTVALRAVPV